MVSKEDFEILKQLDRVVDCDDFVQVLGFEFPVYPEHLELSKFVRFDGRKYAMYGFTEEQCKKLVYFTRLLVQCRKNSALSSKLVAPTASAAQACKVESMLEKTTTHDQFSKLIENMKRPPPNVISEANKMDTGVFLAVYLGKEDKLRELVEEDPSCVNKKNRYGWTPLHYVMCIGCSDAATILTQAGADPYLLNNEKDNPMVLGAKWGHRSTVNNVCNVLKTLKGPEYVKKLLTTEDYKKRHPLHYAAENKQHVVCDVLLGSGADPNHPDENGQTPTFLACKSGNLDTIKVLYKKWNGDIQIADKNNETPFDAFPRDKELIKSL